MEGPARFYVPETEAKEIRKMLGIEEESVQKDTTAHDLAYAAYPKTMKALDTIKDLDHMYQMFKDRMIMCFEKNKFESLRFIMLTYVACLHPEEMREFVEHLIKMFDVPNRRGTFPDQLLEMMLSEWDLMASAALRMREEKTNG